ncbi:hypothetical protein ACFZCV_20855 [Streptomyces sp. NPDC007920]|uniref:hypothetical protein n=1 Tax=Streptomyces sp. NPDC007920 TaxID=3364794 RepID=UPI0036EA5C22
MSTHIAVQAAVVTMLVAKRPQLAQLPIDWQLKSDGSIYIDMALRSDAALVPQAAAELARAMRGAREYSFDLRQDDGTVTRTFQVEGKPSGVPVEFLASQRGLRPDEAAASEGGDGA